MRGLEGQNGEAAERPPGAPSPVVGHRKGKPRRGLAKALLIAGVIFVLIGAAMAISSATMGEPTIPPGTPSEILSMQALDDPAGLTADGIISYQNDPYGFDVFFGEANVDPPTEAGATPLLQSIDGDWYGSGAHVSVDGADRGEAVPAIASADWGESLPDHAERTITPSMHVGLPILATDVHKSLSVVAEMRVHVPYKVGDTGFSVAGGTVKRTATLFVVTPEEMQLRRSLDEWNSRGRTGSSGLITVGFGAVLALFGFVLRRRARASA